MNFFGCGFQPPDQVPPFGKVIEKVGVMLVASYLFSTEIITARFI